jgi:uncharacterized protein
MPADLRPFVLITGASRGIGLALARGFAARRHNLFLVARDAQPLAAAAAGLSGEFGVSVAYAPYDLAHPRAASVVLAALARSGGYVDILVNCAGMAAAGRFTSNDLTQARRTLGLNIEAATELMYACLPGMLERRRGGVLNVASLAGLTPMPHLALYGATKSYLVSLSRAVASEVAGSGVTVSVVMPGPVDTGFFDRNMQTGRRGLTLLPGLSPEAVAHTAIEGFLARQAVVTPGLMGGFCRLLLKMLPYRLVAPFISRAVTGWPASGPVLPSSSPAQAMTAAMPTRRPPAGENSGAMAAQA